MRRLALLVALVLAAGCDQLRTLSEADLLLPPPRGSTYLRYEVQSPSGSWTREFVVSSRDFAELREADGKAYALGLMGTRAWMRVGARTPVEIDGALAADERTQAGWIGMRYLDRARGERVELETCNVRACTLVYTPHDGHALWVDVDRGTHRPTSFSWIARDHAVEACEDVRWDEAGAAPVVASARCSAIVDHVGRETTTWTLAERRDDPSPPSWALIDPADIVPLREPAAPAVFAIADPSTRVYVPVDAGGGPLQLVLDTGAAMTVLTRRALGSAGVVRSPDPPVHVRPPWLPEDTYDAAIVDRVTVGGIELHGVPVLVARDDAPFDGEEAGLLGMDLLSRFVVDVDAPRSTLRIWPRALFAERGFVDVPYRGASHGAVVVAGAVDEIGPMPFILDTGAPINVIVGGPGMHAKHPHHRDDEVMLREDDAACDYLAEVRGLHLGPFGLPRMPAMGHDRRPELPFLDSDSALVGLGVLRHFRFAVDAGGQVVHFAPGPSYAVLTRMGLEIDDRDGAPTITRVVDAEHDWQKPLREGDVVRSVGGRTVRTRDEALVALASATSSRDVSLVVERRGNRLGRRILLR